MNHLDYILNFPQINREVYGYCRNNKPNDHCVWVDIGLSAPIECWVETDEHLRNRIKEKISE
jgi:hypothetical protein